MQTGKSLPLLAWYDREARDLPWRVRPAARAAGARADPYRVWLSEIMLQQTTVAAVRAYFLKFTARWPRVQDLAAAEDAEVMAAWAGLGYYARARNLLACAREVARLGAFPDTEAGLRALPGIGAYTAAAVAAIAFDRVATVVDGNVERVVARLFDVQTPLPRAKAELTALAATLTDPERPGDHAQAMMDLGATICTPRNPACAICPLMADCLGRARGTAPELPRKLPKAAKPLRRGLAYVARRADGAWLLETRPPRGLLGGMLAWPCSDWTEGAPQPAPPAAADWQALNTPARHTFTHFHLELSVLTARLPMEAAPSRGQFLPPGAFRPGDLPGLMQKVHSLAAATFRDMDSDGPAASPVAP